MDKFFQALAALLPTGFAWPRDPGSTLMRVIRALAGTFSEHHDFTTEAVRQWQPATTVNRLAEWEEATGLPDPCFTPPLELLLPGRYPVDAGRIASTTRGTPGTYIDDAGVVRTAAANVARYEGGRLVVEGASSNLVTFPEQFDNAFWSKNNLTVAPNATLAPDGNMTADRLIEAAVAAVNATIFFTTAYTVGNAYSAFAFFKADSRNRVRIFTDGTPFGASQSVSFLLASGALLIRSGTPKAVIVPLANGWFLCAMTTPATVTNGSNVIFRAAIEDGAGSIVYAGDGVSGLYAWGGQLNLGEVGSYIPGGNRSADQIYLFPTEAATRDLRRKLLLSRLRGPVLAYDNSSPASPEAIVAICAGLGYVATAAYNTPFRCGVNRVGDRLGALDGKLYVTVTLQSKAFRVGTSRVGQRLLEGQLNGGELACYLQRVIPARYQLNMIFI